MSFHRVVIAWDALRSSLWFLPTLIVVGLVTLAIVLVEVDGAVDAHTLARFPRLFGAGAEGTRGMLEAIASAMITVAGVTFSITIVALSLTSSQYSSRVLRNFVRDRSNQTVLGIFVGIYAYCLIVLRTIRGGDDPFVPSIATLGGVVLAFAGIALLIHFIHHISRAIQAVHILAAIHEETAAAIEHLYPDPIVGEDDTYAVPPLDDAAWHTIDAQRSGYVQGVDGDALIALATERGGIIQLLWQIGDFVAAGQPLARVTYPAADAPDATLRRAIIQGDQRTVAQDAAFGLRQIVDIALKALSPGINDPTTAVMCIDRLLALLLQLACRRIPSALRRVNGQLRVIAPTHDFASFVALAVDDIRCQSRTQPAVLLRLASMLGAVRGAVIDSQRAIPVLAALETVRAAALDLPDADARGKVLHAIAATAPRHPAVPAGTPRR